MIVPIATLDNYIWHYNSGVDGGDLTYIGQTIETEKTEEIVNNDGREFCFHCNAKTKIVPTGFGTKCYNICPKCKI
jgi:hypothetical protein